MGCFSTENTILFEPDYIACAIFLALLVKVRCRKTAVTTKQNSDCRIIIQIFIKYRLQEVNFYTDSTFSTYKDHLILAADGSDINIPTTAETLKLYGSASRKNTKPQAQIGLGCIYDVMNRMILESDCNKVKFDEMRLAEKQMERIPETIGSIPYIIIMDRGYPSTPAFIHMMDKDIKFIVRLKSSDYKKEQSSLAEKDQIVKIKLDKSRIRHYEGTPDGERMKELGEISLRMVKILLENGSLEVLATNLKNDLIYILLETDDQKKNILFQQIYEDISKNLVPIRPDRHYARTKGRLAGKYSNTHKRAY